MESLKRETMSSLVLALELKMGFSKSKIYCILSTEKWVMALGLEYLKGVCSNYIRASYIHEIITMQSLLFHWGSEVTSI